ncbi:hypothetical protein [Sediminibacter sp. Hel_I_10]|uniref:hypothetical protein n=1 Tax=Sediminibacter sp. Hel_I_10 TaxID=1392490 RepID=UPI00047A770F|nr:hypothetical protein [Sediminibacter sp. Hel_I_10]
MFKRIIDLSIKHSSLAVMALGSLSIFIANLGFKNVMSVDGYYQYSIIITVLTLLTSFGVFGIEQVFLRLSEVRENKKILLDVKLIKIALIAALFSSVLASVYFIVILKLNINYFTTFFLSLGVICSMLLYNVFRLGSQFFYSQTIQNSWKLTIGFLAFYFLFIGELAYYLRIVTIVLWIVITVSFIFLIKKNKIKLNDKLGYNEILLFSFHFSIALLTLSFLAQGDRFFIEFLFTKKEFGDYFYLGTVFLFPFSLLQSYVGFKELVYIKYRDIDIKKRILSILKVSLLLTGFIILLAYFLTEWNVLKIDFAENFIIIAMFLIMGNTKMIYSLFSAIIGVKAGLNDIKKMNFIFILLSLIILMFFYFMDKSVVITICFFSFLWLIRVFIWGFYSKKYF